MFGRDRNRRDGGRRRGGGPLNIIGSGISLAAEAIAHQRAKSKSPNAADSSSQPSDLPPPYAEQPRDGSRRTQFEDLDETSEMFVQTDAITKHDEAVWELDEASYELQRGYAGGSASQKAVIPKALMNDPAPISKLVNAFVAAYPPPQIDGLACLACLVIIPQRRPNARERGFVRAYAPLMEPSGISQSTWMQFLDFYDESLKYSNVIKVISVTGNILGLIPSAACFAASMALTITSKVAGSLQSTQRSNDFITRMNEQWFIPMGMVCLVLKYTPDSKTGGFDMQQSLGNATGPVHRNFKKAHGGTNDVEMPAAAPLVFPTIDAVSGVGDGSQSPQPTAEDEEKLNKFQRSMRFVADYRDRRARAQFAIDNPDSELARASRDATKFESKLADPGNFGGIRDVRKLLPSASEYTGSQYGRQRQDARLGGRERRHQGRRRDDDDESALRSRSRGARRERRGLLAGGLLGAAGDRSPLTVVKKIIQKDVLYMMIVPMPSQEQLAQTSDVLPPGMSLVDLQT